MRYKKALVARFAWATRWSVGSAIVSVVLCSGMTPRVARSLPAHRASADSDSTYQRYRTPGTCVAAANRMHARYWRDKRADTVLYVPATDSVPTPVREMVRACAERFTLATVPVDQLIPLAQLRLVLGDDAGAADAIARLLATPGARDASARAWLLQLTIRALLDAKPMRLDLARRYLAQLDSLGAGAASSRFMAHWYWGTYAWEAGRLADAESAVNASFSAFNELHKPEQINLIDSIEGEYFLKAQIVGARRGGPAALALLDTAERVVSSLMPPDAPWAYFMRGFFRQVMSTQRGFYAPIGRAASPISGDKWFATGGDTVFPKRGRVTLVVLVSQYTSFRTFATLKRLRSQYAARGLDIVCIAATEAYFRSALMPSPDEEVPELHSWYIDFIHAPATFAIQVGQLRELPDGRKELMPSTNQQHYAFGLSGVVVGKAGTIEMVLEVSPVNEAMLSQFIDAELKKP